jgi:hypothetical protein
MEPNLTPWPRKTLHLKSLTTQMKVQGHPLIWAHTCLTGPQPPPRRQAQFYLTCQRIMTCLHMQISMDYSPGLLMDKSSSSQSSSNRFRTPKPQLAGFVDPINSKALFSQSRLNSAMQRRPGMPFPRLKLTAMVIYIRCSQSARGI